MKLHVKKKDIELLVKNERYDEIQKILYSSLSKPYADVILGYRYINPNYVVNMTLNEIRSMNYEDKLKHFKPYFLKRKFKEIFAKKTLTENEKQYIKLFGGSIKKHRKIWEGNIEEETYNNLKQLYEIDKENYYIGIHRTANEVEDILENGIICRNNELSTHVQRMDNFDFMLREIKLCSEYKGSKGCFIVKIPKEYVDNGTMPIYYQDGEKIRLNPKYVVGYVPVEKGKILYLELNDQLNIVSSTIKNDERFAKKL